MAMRTGAYRTGAYSSTVRLINFVQCCSLYQQKFAVWLIYFRIFGTPGTRPPVKMSHHFESHCWTASKQPRTEKKQWLSRKMVQTQNSLLQYPHNSITRFLNILLSLGSLFYHACDCERWFSGKADVAGRMVVCSFGLFYLGFTHPLHLKTSENKDLR